MSPSSELLISPQLNADVNPFVNLTYRQRLYSGDLEARLGYTHESDIDGSGKRFGEATSRSYILAHGRFDINDFWKWGFSAERASEDLIFDKYGVRSVYAQRGLFTTDDHRLASQLYTTRQDQRSYLSISAVQVQGLRPFDNDRTFPTIAPLVEARWEPDQTILGGRLVVTGSGVALTREQSPTLTPTAADPRPAGVDSRRATGQVDWRRDFTFASGLRISPFAQGRLDAYDVGDLSLGLNTQGSYVTKSASLTRGLGVAGADISMPFFKALKNGTMILEPLAQVAISPDSDADSRIPNEDSVAFEFDETNLFRVNKSPGFDLYEGGQRVNLGGRLQLNMDDGRNLSFLAGRSLRTKRDDVFPARTGLQAKGSDWIVAAEGSPMSGVSLFSRARLDPQSFAFRGSQRLSLLWLSLYSLSAGQS